MDKETCFTIPKDVTHGRGYVYSLQYHIVWCTKYRKRILASGLDEEVKAHLRITAEDLQAKILAMEVMPDHIHLLLDCKPQFRPSDAIKVFKGNTARWLFLNHPELRGSYGADICGTQATSWPRSVNDPGSRLKGTSKSKRHSSKRKELLDETDHCLWRSDSCCFHEACAGYGTYIPAGCYLPDQSVR